MNENIVEQAVRVITRPPEPTLFVSNALPAISNGDSTRVGSLTADADRFVRWRQTSSQPERYDP